jgi:hypothetical protein
VLIGTLAGLTIGGAAMLAGETDFGVFGMANPPPLGVRPPLWPAHAVMMAIAVRPPKKRNAACLKCAFMQLSQ